ncbi:hypothetical protein BMJ89_004021 [Salmonella enterica subsp. enterica serovar 4,[5],12:i:-]|nr:hypothetical protein [Salmonella enterica subsp. enterica serovar 4,[5],12:i:-]
MTDVPAASLTQSGIVQLSSAINSSSETLAATPKAVKAAYDLANGKYTAQDATTAQKGIVQLSSATNSASETLAATPKAVKAAYDLANGKYTAQDATTAQKGLVQLSSDTNSTSETLAATPKAVKAAYDLAAGKAPSSHTHPWNQITGVPTASLTAKGITQLSSATNSTSEVLAATPKAVKAAYDLANGKQAADATLTALAALATAADKLPYFTGVDRAALTALTSVGRAILGKTSIQSVLDYLGLGEAAKRDVGTGDNQIPDMGAFASGSGWFRLPGGYIVQFGTFSGNTTRFISGHFPIPFPNQPMVSVSVMSDAVQSDPSNPAPQVLSVNFEHISNSAWRVATSDISQHYRFSYISIGR